MNKKQNRKAALVSFHPTWRNDGQDEARAQAYIEGYRFASPAIEELKLAQVRLFQLDGYSEQYKRIHTVLRQMVNA